MPVNSSRCNVNWVNWHPVLKEAGEKVSVLHHLLGGRPGRIDAELRSAVERAVTAVEPLLLRTRGYPRAYCQPVAAALEYARALAAEIPGPIEVSREAYAGDALVHALFSSAHAIDEACGASHAMHAYRQQAPQSREVYALMGMRRMEKTRLGMELSGQHVQRDVHQQVVYFTSHTLEHPAASEIQVRQQMAGAFFDSLIGKVGARVQRRKQRKKRLAAEKDQLMARLRMADAGNKARLQRSIAEKSRRLQAMTRALDLRNYRRDFEIVLLNPQRHLRLLPTAIVLDSMGIRRPDGHQQGAQFTFCDLVGYDRRLWTVTMVHCRDLHAESFAMQLEKAQRRLAV